MLIGQGCVDLRDVSPRGRIVQGIQNPGYTKSQTDRPGTHCSGIIQHPVTDDTGFRGGGGQIQSNKSSVVVFSFFYISERKSTFAYFCEIFREYFLRKSSFSFSILVANMQKRISAKVFAKMHNN